MRPPPAYKQDLKTRERRLFLQGVVSPVPPRCKETGKDAHRRSGSETSWVQAADRAVPVEASRTMVVSVWVLLKA